MKTASKVKEIKSGFNDEFENYLKKQCIKTTFNGSELETFSWYKKVLGLVQTTPESGCNKVRLALEKSGD